jgi:hypothetical protein
MELPKVPTDNLYKFIALSGVVFMVTSAFPVYWQAKLKFELIQVQGEKWKATKKKNWACADTDYLRTKTNKLKEETSKWKAARDLEAAEPQLIEKKRLEIRTEAHEIRAGITETERLYRDSEIAAIEVKTKEKEIAQRLEVIRLLKYVAAGGLSSGAILSVFGFFLWYHKLQKYQDKIVKKQAEDN